MLTQVEMLQLSPWDFDQSEYGWRSLDRCNDMRGALEVSPGGDAGLPGHTLEGIPVAQDRYLRP